MKIWIEMHNGVVAIPEFSAPRLGARSSLVTINTDLSSDARGVLYALGAFSGGWRSGSKTGS